VSGHRDLERVVLAAAVGAAVAIALPWDLVRLVAALPLALFLPGYAIVAAAFAGHDLERPQQLMLSLLCSLAVLALGGLLLNYLPGGLRTATWAVLLFILVVAASGVAVLRRPTAPRTPGRSRLRLGAIRRWDLPLLAGAGVAVVAALILAFTPLPAGRAAGYTALWMLPGSGGQQGPLRVGVESAEHGSLAYLLVVDSGKARPQDFRFSLDPGGERTFTLPLRVPVGAKVRVEASLYLAGRPDRPYRRVVLWLPKQGTSG
jgi:hypothetical protein